MIPRSCRKTFWRSTPAAFLLSLYFLAFTLAPADTRAEKTVSQPANSPRFTLQMNEDDLPSSGNTVDVAALGSRAMSILDEAAQDLQTMLQFKSARTIQLRFLSPEKFIREARAPRWATGVFYRGEILVPLSESQTDDDELERTLRHEYLHAVSAQLTNSRCPAWLDEGLAQIFEHGPDLRLHPVLSGWMQRRPLVPLNQLKSDFESQNRNIAATAYAESYFAAETIVRRYGLERLLAYFELLRSGSDQAGAFRSVFNMPLDQFEKMLADEIRKVQR